MENVKARSLTPNVNYPRRDSVLQKAYSFFNEVSNDIKSNIMEKSKIFNLKEAFNATRLNQKIVNESYIKKIVWIEEKNDKITKLKKAMSKLY